MTETPLVTVGAQLDIKVAELLPPMSLPVPPELIAVLPAWARRQTPEVTTERAGLSATVSRKYYGVE